VLPSNRAGSLVSSCLISTQVLKNILTVSFIGPRNHAQLGPFWRPLPANLYAERLSSVLLTDGSFIIRVDIFYIASPLFPDDNYMAKSMVYSVLVLEIAQTAISSLDVYVALAQTFGSTANLDSINQHWLTVPIFGALSEYSTNRVHSECYL
jgi:hypothetical protein